MLFETELVPPFLFLRQLIPRTESEVIVIKTPVSRVGNKTAILHILYALFPIQYGRFVDVFGGSGSVLLGNPEICPFEVYTTSTAILLICFAV